MSTRKNVLFVFTSVDKNLLGNPSGWYLPEGAHPYYVLSPKHNITFASPKGPNPPVDSVSIDQFKDDDECVKFLGDSVAQKFLAEAKKLSDVNAKDYDAVLYVGGCITPRFPVHKRLEAEQASLNGFF
ncbi:hypothetical protein FRB94_003663 [Tulasnella sp. JGI-2019a]|nr:hypothetical protein FRB93_005250 [Tulasnella sp. JGI-2019a]KAG9002743.1 hypothetical protein FRB94_003663 [Tulasnella sp. JGI-2019a]